VTNKKETVARIEQMKNVCRISVPDGRITVKWIVGKCG
jgi:hypothetical protein